jgi:FKBP-type peptidyl-prolyl cis-trans isomerase
LVEQRKSGLGVQVLERASVCPSKAQVGDKLAVHYTGTLKDGTVFDETFKVLALCPPCKSTRRTLCP